MLFEQASHCLDNRTCTDATRCLNWCLSRPRLGFAGGMDQVTFTLPPTPGFMNRWGQAYPAIPIASTMKRTGSSSSTWRRHPNLILSNYTKAVSPLLQTGSEAMLGEVLTHWFAVHFWQYCFYNDDCFVHTVVSFRSCVYKSFSLFFFFLPSFVISSQEDDFWETNVCQFWIWKSTLLWFCWIDSFAHCCLLSVMWWRIFDNFISRMQLAPLLN